MKRTFLLFSLLIMISLGLRVSVNAQTTSKFKGQTLTIFNVEDYISQGIDDPSLLTYANSSIVIGNLTQIYDYDNNLHICNFAKDSSINNGIAVNIDNIPNPGILHY